MSVSQYLPLARGILLGAALAMTSSAALAQKREFSFAYDQPKNSGYGIGAEMFSKKLGELSKGTLSINQYPGAQLGTEAQTLQKVQTGDIDFVMLSTANASTAQPESGVFSIHFIFRNEAHAIKVLGDPTVIAAMRSRPISSASERWRLAAAWWRPGWTTAGHRWCARRNICRRC